MIELTTNAGKACRMLFVLGALKPESSGVSSGSDAKVYDIE